MNNQERQQTLELNTANLRRMLMQAFDDDELTTFCFDYFPPVYENFASGMRRLLKTQLLIDYCHRYGKFVELMERVKEINEYQYNKFAATIWTTSNRLQKQESSIIEGTYDVLNITVAGNFSSLSPEQLEAVVGAFSGALAGILSIPQHEIRVLEVATGSLILRVLMPSQIVTQLETMYKEDEMLAKELGIQSITPTTDWSDSSARLLKAIKKAIKTRFPSLDDEEIVQLSNIVLEEIGDHLIAGHELAFVKPGSDQNAELIVLGFKTTE